LAAVRSISSNPERFAQQYSTPGLAPGVGNNGQRMEQDQHRSAAASGIAPQIVLDDEDEGISLGEIIGIILEYRWLVAALTLVAVIMGLFVVVVSRPVYRADGLIQVEEKTSGMGSLKALQPLLGDDTTVSAELEILASRMVLGRVVDRLKLDIVAAPRTMPVIGNAIARRHVGSEPNDAVFGLSSYAWGGENIQVDSLEVPKPYLDERLLLIAGRSRCLYHP
jgi:tyrosine-protein kinase Etk/Wzc